MPGRIALDALAVQKADGLVRAAGTGVGPALGAGRRRSSVSVAGQAAWTALGARLCERSSGLRVAQRIRVEAAAPAWPQPGSVAGWAPGRADNLGSTLAAWAPDASCRPRRRRRVWVAGRSGRPSPTADVGIAVQLAGLRLASTGGPARRPSRDRRCRADTPGVDPNLGRRCHVPCVASPPCPPRSRRVGRSAHRRRRRTRTGEAATGAGLPQRPRPPDPGHGGGGGAAPPHARTIVGGRRARAEHGAGCPVRTLVFLAGMGYAPIGSALLGLGMGVPASIIPADVSQTLSDDRRRSARGRFPGSDGTVRILGSLTSGARCGGSRRRPDGRRPSTNGPRRVGRPHLATPTVGR